MDKSVPAMVFARAELNAEQVCLLEKRGGCYQGTTWAELSDEVKHLALGLIELGIEVGDNVALMCSTRKAWAVADLAILSCGAVNVPIYHTNRQKQILHILQDAAVKVLFLGEKEYLGEVLPVWEKLPCLQTIILLTGEVENIDNILSANQVSEIGRHCLAVLESEWRSRWSGLTHDDLASIIYTSGTTGDPKGVMLTHGNFLSDVEACYQAVKVYPSDRALSFLPLSHVLERTAGYYLMLYSGASIAYAESVDTLALNLQEVKPSIMFSVPRVFEKIFVKVHDSATQGSYVKRQIFYWALATGRKWHLEHRRSWWMSLKATIAHKLVWRKIQQQLGGNVRAFVSGGAPLLREVGEFFYSFGITILEGYGLTETSPVVAVNRLDSPEFGTVGPLCFNVDVKIADDGEIMIKGPMVMQGYYGKPEETAKVIRDGWFYSGDIGHLNEQGRLVITDRKKDIIVTSGGKNISPQNLECALKLDKYIAEAVVFGNNRKYLGALIVPNFTNLKQYADYKQILFHDHDDLVNHPDIQEFLQRRVSRALQDFPEHEQVRKIGILPQEFSQESGELTATLKTKRRVIEQKYGKMIDAMYSQVADISSNQSQHQTHYEKKEARAVSL